MIPALLADGLTTAPATGTLGIGKLSDCLSCVVTRELNGQYELEMEYPVNGIRFNDITLRRFIYVKPDQTADPQLFRIYQISKPMMGRIIVNARHISYDLQGYAVTPFTADTISLALSGLTANAVPTCPFTFTTTRSTASTFSVKVPSAIWSLMAGQEGSLLDTYHGEYDFNNFSVSLENRVGADHGYQIRYGKNLKTLVQDENCANVYTAVYPYWLSAEGTVMTLPEKTVEASGTYSFTRVLALDMSSNFTEEPTEAQLRAAAQSYIINNDIGTPDVSLTIDFVALWQTEQYKDIHPLERVALGDTVSVEFEQMGVDATARVVSFRFDCLTERFQDITLGKVQQTFANIIVEQEKAIEEAPTRSFVEQISAELSKAMLGIHGGCVRLIDTNGDGSPDELYIADSDDIDQAVKVWRFNYLGWAASTSGYSGPYTMGATLEDGILANAVTAANLVAGTIRSADGTTVNIDLDNGIVEMNAQRFLLKGNDLDDYFNISFVDGHPVVRIGSATNPIILKQMNDRIAFCDPDGNELAYWTNNTFRLVELQSFQLGTLELVSQPNGSVSFVEGD